MWLLLLALPWRPWSTAEREEALVGTETTDFTEVTALIPARDEASCVTACLSALVAQGHLAQIILIDDESADGTGEIAQTLNIDNLTVLTGTSPPPGWSGKLWALEQGFASVRTNRTLLLDADIVLEPGILAALNKRMSGNQLHLVSVMARLRIENRWEKLLLPAFIYFFKLLYPFSLSNNPKSRVAAAAGGCVLIDTKALRSIGGFNSLRNAIIDDCTLARLVKTEGKQTWIGLSHDVRAIRPYESLTKIWDMVARTAFTQLGYSITMLGLCTVLLTLTFVIPTVGLLYGTGFVPFVALVAFVAMGVSYLPIIHFYGLRPVWILALPLAACLFLAMTWSSAVRYWGGERARWKDRSYEKAFDDQK